MKRVFNLLAMGLILLFWIGVLAGLFGLLPGKLNGFLPVCGGIVVLFHWLQASFIKAACQRYFVITRTEFIGVLVFGVFGMTNIRQRLKKMIDDALQGPQS
ncbi:MAG: DUF1145 domain-containing protein [Aeromonas sp.]